MRLLLVVILLSAPALLMCEDEYSDEQESNMNTGYFTENGALDEREFEAEERDEEVDEFFKRKMDVPKDQL